MSKITLHIAGSEEKKQILLLDMYSVIIKEILFHTHLNILASRSMTGSQRRFGRRGCLQRLGME